MSNINGVEISVEILDNAIEEIASPIEDYAAEQARKYAQEASDSANNAKMSQNMSEAWAESEVAPAGEGTRSSKTWSNVSRQWAESEIEPDNVVGARSSKTWNARARNWAESDVEPNGIAGAKSSKTWAEESARNAGNSAQSAAQSASSAQASQDSAASAAVSATAADNSATLARQSADNAADKLAQMQVDLRIKADTHNAVLTGSPTAPTPDGSNSNQLANVEYVAQKIAELVNGSDAALDTLKELANALGNDPNFATTVMDAVGKKLDATAIAVGAKQDGQGNIIADTYATKAELAGTDKTLATVAKTGKYGDLLDKPTIPDKTSQLTNDSYFVSTDSDGNLTVSGTITGSRVYNAVYNDYAEFFPRGDITTAGDIIALDMNSDKEQYIKATESSECIVGVHSEEFAQIIGGMTIEPTDNIMEKNLPKFIPVALAGRVHVKLMGPAIAGDWVVPSSIPGVGRIATTDDDLTKAVGRIVKADKFQNVRLVKILVRR